MKDQLQAEIEWRIKFHLINKLIQCGFRLNSISCLIHEFNKLTEDIQSDYLINEAAIELILPHESRTVLKKSIHQTNFYLKVWFDWMISEYYNSNEM